MAQTKTPYRKFLAITDIPNHEWLTIREYLCSDNNQNRDFAKALTLAKTCNHPDAIWLTQVCGDLMNDLEYLDQLTHNELETKVLARLVENFPDKRALCFWTTMQLLPKNLRYAKLIEALPYPYAYTLLVSDSMDSNTQLNTWTQNLIELGERDGYYFAARSDVFGVSNNDLTELDLTDQDLVNKESPLKKDASRKSYIKSMYIKAAELGHNGAIYRLRNLSSCCMLESSFWLCQGIIFQPDAESIYRLLEIIDEIIRKGYTRTYVDKQILWQSCLVIRGHINVETTVVRGIIMSTGIYKVYDDSVATFITSAIKGIAKCDLWLKKARRSMDMASLIMKKIFNVPKDVRLLINALVFDDVVSFE